MDNQPLDPNVMIKFIAILNWIVKRNRYSVPVRESFPSHKSESEHTFIFKNEPVTVSVTVQDNQRWPYYEHVLSGVATVCELNFNEDVDHVLFPMANRSQCLEFTSRIVDQIFLEVEIGVHFRNGYGFEGGQNG